MIADDRPGNRGCLITDKVFAVTASVARQCRSNNCRIDDLGFASPRSHRRCDKHAINKRNFDASHTREFGSRVSRRIQDLWTSSPGELPVTPTI
ncbi:hypothetical protein ACETRX_17435 [Labrys portucalensis]|uniref:Transposase n=1 Tax=Labrys neptuniae TaxID=376174 RepID=A0ABV6ZGU7_9HYPH